MYDPVLGRWMTTDPLAEKYYSISPYAYCANNPVKYIDPDGMEFTDAAWDWINRLMDNISSQQSRNNDRIASKESMLAAGGLSDRQTSRLNRQINNLQSSNARLETVRGEVNMLAESSQIYDVKTDNSRDMGSIEFNFSNGNAEIMMPSNGSIGLFSHELKHAYQFETGELSLRYKGFNLLYDKHDEVAAYNRGAMFGEPAYGIYTLPSIYKSLPMGPIDATNHPNLKHVLSKSSALQNIANLSNSAFRINGVTYYK
jgi:hypothetical protein